MASSGMLRGVALVRTDVSEERNVSRLLVTTNVVPSSPILVTLMMEALSLASRRKDHTPANPRSSATWNLPKIIPR
jgi:hypothetical protein